MISPQKISFALLFIFFFNSCTNSSITDPRSQRWSTRYSDIEKISITYSIANKHYEDGKQRENGRLIRDAISDLTFLVDEFQHDNSAEKLKEIHKFMAEKLNYYLELIDESKKKNFIFTTAGYYKKILNFFPDNEEAKSYQIEYRTEIGKRLKINLELGYKSLKENKFNNATRYFKLVLNFQPNSVQAKKGIKQVKYYKHQANLLAAKQARIKTKKIASKPVPIPIKDVQVAEIEEIEEVPSLTDNEKNKLYQLGLDAYNKKDFLKAYDYFDTINDENFKDTIHYLTRSEEKIETLGLNDD